MNNKQFQVRRDAFYKSRLVEIPEANLDLEDGQIMVKVNKFAYTANNITYAVAGEMIGYWQFFPPQGEESAAWGMIPVWGFAEIVKSNANGINIGERLFGYFPPANFLKMQAVGITESRLIDGSEHRSQLPVGYNIYRRVNNEKGYSAEFDNERMLLFPLHLTSFCLCDSLQDNQWFGARQVVILSASSKTSTGLAYAIQEQTDSPKVIAATSERNLAFVNNLKIYDSSVTYDELRSIDATIPTVIVDMSGNTEVLHTLHSHLNDNMKFTLNVGITHWKSTKPKEGINQDRSKFFFAPSHIQKRIKEWGADGFDKKTSKFLRETAIKTKEWLNIKNIDGLEELAVIHPSVCEGKIPADQGLIVKL